MFYILIVVMVMLTIMHLPKLIKLYTFKKVGFTICKLNFNKSEFKSMGLGIREAWTQILVLPLTSNMITCALVFLPIKPHRVNIRLTQYILKHFDQLVPYSWPSTDETIHITCEKILCSENIF